MSAETVYPNAPVPTRDVEPVADLPVAGERVVSYFGAVVAGDRAAPRLSTARVAELRARIAAGTYNSPELLGEVAVRLLESGDLAG